MKQDFYMKIYQQVSVLAGETATQFTPIMYMLGFGLLASIPALILSKLISPRRRYNPVKFLPMEWISQTHAQCSIASHDSFLPANYHEIHWIGNR